MSVPARFAGQKGKCPGCGNPAEVPSASDAPPATVDPTTVPHVGLLFEALPTADVIKSSLAGLSRIEPIASGPKLHTMADGEHAFAYIVEFDDHRVRMIGHARPIESRKIDRTIRCSHLFEDVKETLAAHRAHVDCTYLGHHPSAIERYLAVFKIAHCFHRAMIGLVNENAWNSLPAAMLASFGSAEDLAECRESPPAGFWTNAVHFARKDGRIWFGSKGHHLFGVQDFAFLGDTSATEEVTDLFYELLLHCLEGGTRIEPGETLQVGDHHFRFCPVHEYGEFLDGPLGTIVLERAS